MLCETGTLEDLKRKGYGAEEKFDGTRMKVKKQGKVSLTSRDGIDYTARLGEVVEAFQSRIKKPCEVDGEVIYVNPSTGQIEFTPCQRRCATEDLGKVMYLRYKYPVKYAVFDATSIDGEDITSRGWEERKELLKTLIPANDSVLMYVQHRFDLERFFAEVKAREDEGLVAKQKDSPYEYSRSYSWLKIKNWRFEECQVVGYTLGKNSRAGFFGALVLARHGEHRGVVGSGFNEWELRKVKDLIADAPQVAQPFDIGEPYTAVKIDLRVLVKYYKITKEGKVMRFPVFERFA
jgi:ATP-dependent DNA ligase